MCFCFCSLQLVPAMVGMFAYKAAALVQVYRDNEDLRLIFPDNGEESSDWRVDFRITQIWFIWSFDLKMGKWMFPRKSTRLLGHTFNFLFLWLSILELSVERPWIKLFVLSWKNPFNRTRSFDLQLLLFQTNSNSQKLIAKNCRPIPI